jgi:hypothetical protein
LGQKSLQYQADIEEAEFKDIAANGARVSLSATKNRRRKRPPQRETGVKHHASMVTSGSDRRAREKSDRRIMRR